MFSPNLRVLFCSSSFWLNRSFNFWIRFNISHFLLEFLIDESMMYFLVRFTFDFSCFGSFDSFSFRFQFLVFDLHSIIASWFSEFDMVMVLWVSLWRESPCLHFGSCNHFLDFTFASIDRNWLISSRISSSP